jgi:hypothetical protein
MGHHGKGARAVPVLFAGGDLATSFLGRRTARRGCSHAHRRSPGLGLENDDILVVHTRLAFASGSREGAMIINLKKDGKIFRIESGVSDLT